MLTGRRSEQGKLAGFDLGADDYIAKPFSLKELMVRVRALWQQARPDLPAQGQTLSHSGLTVDVGRYEVTVNGKIISITPTELRILVALLKTPGCVVSRHELLFQLRGNSYERDERTIETHISNLRAQASECIRKDALHPRNLWKRL